MIVILPHIIMILSKNIKSYNPHFVHCLLSVLQIFDNIEAVSQRFQNAKTCQQMYSVIIPLLIKYICEDQDNNKQISDIIIEFVAENLAINASLLEAVKSLPRSIVAFVQQLLNSYNETHGKSTKKKKRKKSNTQTKDNMHAKEARNGIDVFDGNGDVDEARNRKKK
eukprot:UN12779